MAMAPDEDAMIAERLDNESRRALPIFSVENDDNGLYIFTDGPDDSMMGLTSVRSSALAADVIRVQQRAPHSLRMVVEVRRRGLPISGDAIGAYTLECTEQGAQLSYRTKGHGKGHMAAVAKAAALPVAKAPGPAIAKAPGPPAPAAPMAVEPAVEPAVPPIAAEPAVEPAPEPHAKAKAKAKANGKAKAANGVAKAAQGVAKAFAKAKAGGH